MENNLPRDLIRLRIMLQKLCDGFDKNGLNKKSALTMRQKVLFMLDECGALSPQYLISNLGIAKSNLTILCQSLMVEGLIESKKCQTDQRSIIYTITPQGHVELEDFLQTIQNEHKGLFKSAKEQRVVDKKVLDVINYLKSRG